MRASSGIVRLRRLVLPVYLATARGVVLMIGGGLGLEIFPRVDAGRFQLRVKAPAGLRVEKTEEIVQDALAMIREEAIEVSVGYVGLIPSSYPINAIFQWTGGPEEAVLRVAMKQAAHVDIEALKRRLRERLGAKLSAVKFSFEPADIVSDVMSFGSPTPVEVAISGPNFAENRAHVEKVRAELEAIPTLRDVRYGQSLD